MPQHVGMEWKRHFGGRPKPRHHPAKGNCGHRGAAFAHEDVSAGFLFALETSQGAKFYTVLGERHLRHVLLSYQQYYNETRTHLSLDKDAPIPRAVETIGRILSRRVLAGSHHQYVRT
jgi:hypothetical protein